MKYLYQNKITGRCLNFAAALVLLLTALLFVCVQPARAAEYSNNGAGYTAVLYDNTNGLPTSDANAIVQTSEGFIWIGSYSGLIRYDGNEFYRYDSSIGMSSVVSLFADSKDRLWIGTNDSGVFVQENQEFRSYGRDEGLRSLSIRSVLEDADGNILIATTMGMVYIDTENVMHVLDEPLINQDYICELVEGDNDEIFGLTLSGNFFTIKDLKLQDYYDAAAMGYGVINTVYPDPEREGWLYLGTQSATIVHGDLANNMKDAEVISTGSQKMVRCIRLIDGQLWSCAESGIGRLSDGTYYPLEDVPMTNSIEHVIEDYEGNLWFTSSRQGVMKIVPNRFTDISDLASLPPLVVNSTCLNRELLYLGTDSGLTIVDSSYKQVTNELTDLLKDARIRSIYTDRDGNLWFGTNSDYGLVHYFPETEKWDIYTTENGLASNRARTMHEMSDGRIAVATNAGVNILENGEITALYDGEQGIKNLEILCLEESPDGKIYAGSDGDGIYVIDNGKISRLGFDSGLRSEVILRIRRDPSEEGLYWIVTSNSLAYMRDEQVTTIHSFPYANNFDIFFDASDRLWVLSSNGIYVVKREDMFTDDGIDYTLFDTKSGLPCAPTANAFSFLNGDGTLYIAAATGASAVNINNDTEGNDSVRLAVPYLMADDTCVFPDENGQVNIPADCKRLTLYDYAFTYSLNNPHLMYQLEGFDDEAVNLTRQELRPVTYTNLAGGSYRFHFAVIDTMNGTEKQALDLTVVKEKFIYEYIWFWIVIAAIVLAVIVGVILFYFRRKTQALLQKQAEQKQLIHEISSVFASCIDMKDPYTNGHSHRVAEYSAMLAEKLGKTKDEIDEIYNIALLHDIGKIAIPDSILNKPDRLTDEEFAIMKSHSQKGYEILKDISIAPELAIGAGYHHERVDGRGYPNGLTAEEIPEIAQIIAVADTFDAMYSTRPYRKQLDIRVVADEMKRSEGTQLNADVVEALLQLIDEGRIGGMV